MARQILFGAQHAQPFARPFADFARIRAEEGRRDGNLFAFDEHEVQREVMAFHAPAPRRFRVGFAENRHEITLRVAWRAFALFEVADSGLIRKPGAFA